MIDPNNPRDVYFYSACAMALGGVITRPFDGVIESQAASVLPIDGGMGSARVQNFQFKEIVSFKTGYSLVTGSQSNADGTFATLATAAVDELNILHMVTATKVVSRLASHSPADPNQQQQSTISPFGSQLTGLTVVGCELLVELDTQTFTGLNKQEAFEKAQGRPGATRCGNGMIATSLVKDIKPIKGSCSGLTIAGGQINVPHFGRIHVAQFLLTPFSWRLVMLRVEMGCSAEGTVDVGCTQGNGTTG